MQPVELALPSPLPTTPPHPHEVNRKLLLARGNYDATCGWQDLSSASPIVCYPGDICAKNTILGGVNCCSSTDFPSNCAFPTACVNSVYVSNSCSGFCLNDPLTVRCTNRGLEECVEQKYNIFTLSTYLIAWACGPITSNETIYDSFTTDEGGLTNFVTISQQFVTVTASETPKSAESISTSPGPSSSQTTPSPVPVPAPTPAPSPSKLSGGAIAGIAIGAVIAVAIIAGLIGLLFIQRRKRDKTQPGLAQPISGPMVQTNPKPPPASPPLTDNRTSFMSQPSATSATPLTQNNIANAWQAPSEINPHDSASNIGGPSSPGLPQGASSPVYYSSAGSPEHSVLGPLPGPQYPTGAAAFPNQNPSSSVMSPGSAFGSMPPGAHAPGV